MWSLGSRRLSYRWLQWSLPNCQKCKENHFYRWHNLRRRMREILRGIASWNGCCDVNSDEVPGCFDVLWTRVLSSKFRFLQESGSKLSCYHAEVRRASWVETVRSMDSAHHDLGWDELQYLHDDSEPPSTRVRAYRHQERGRCNEMLKRMEKFRKQTQVMIIK